MFPPGQYWLPQRGYLYGALGIPPEGGDGADTTSSLNQQQTADAANMVTGIVRPAQYDLGNITDFAAARVGAVKTC